MVSSGDSNTNAKRHVLDVVDVLKAHIFKGSREHYKIMLESA